MHAPLFASLFTEDIAGTTVLRAMPLMLGILCILAIAYRYYSAFLAARVACLDDSRTTPAHQFNDGQNYHPTNRWVLFGHHFAAISGAGPLIGPVLAIQYGYMPGLLWLVIGVCLAGAVQDMLVLAASVRRGGKSLAQIALTEPRALRRGGDVGRDPVHRRHRAWRGLGLVVVKARSGGEEGQAAEGTWIDPPSDPRSARFLERTSCRELIADKLVSEARRGITPGVSFDYEIHRSEAFEIRYHEPGTPWISRPEPFQIQVRYGREGLPPPWSASATDWA